MMTQVLHCPYCRGIDIVRHGKSPEGQQRYRCRQCRVGTPALAQGKQAVLQHLKPEQCDRSPHGPGLRLCVGDGRPRSFWNSQRCGSLLVSRVSSPTGGVPTSGMWGRSNTRLGRQIPRKSCAAYSLAHTDPAVGTSDDVLFEAGTHARSGDWPLAQSV
jgi:hypothetical protein